MLQTKIAIIGFTAMTAGAVALWSHSERKPNDGLPASITEPGPTFRAAEKKSEDAPLEITLANALHQDLIQADIRGNGCDYISFFARNNGVRPLRLRFEAGELLASNDSTVAVFHSKVFDIPAKGTVNETLRTVATTSSSKLADEKFLPSTATLPQLEPLFRYFDGHYEVPVPAAQTAVLAVVENLPLTAFARFIVNNGGVQTSMDATPFKVDTCDILTALMLLRKLRLDENLALKVDPQLEVEAMIDPLAHALAMRYYGIEDEWVYWKHQLLEGDASTRHYALYGIARFYPEVALQMLPKWAREPKTSAVFRISAVQALAETQRAEAISMLRQLEHEMSGTDVGRTAHVAANVLDAEFSKPVRVLVAFHTSMKYITLREIESVTEQVAKVAVN